MKTSSKKIARFLSCIAIISVTSVGHADYDALMHGAGVTAQGSYPDWSMKLKGNKVNFTAADIGDHNFKHPSMAPTLRSKQNTTVFHVPNNSHVMSVQVKDIACTDSVTGKSHPVRVVVWIDEDGYVGCGDVE
jgi:uncharacterized membrane protein